MDRQSLKSPVIRLNEWGAAGYINGGHRFLTGVQFAGWAAAG
jgi:hypothetical protein